MALVCIRHLSNKKIIGLIGTLIVVGFVLKYFGIGKYCIMETPPFSGNSIIHQHNIDYLPSLMIIVAATLDGDLLFVFSNMAIGYLLGKVGFIESMDKRVRFKHVLLLGLLYMIMGVIFFFGKRSSIISNPIVNPIITEILYYSGSAFYWITFIYTYNKITWFNHFTSHFEPYGKLGLTNYTLQGFFGVLFFSVLGLYHIHLPLSMVFLISIIFFSIQTVFSTIWIKYFKNGPLEYLWRSATEKKWLPFLNNSHFSPE